MESIRIEAEERKEFGKEKVKQVRESGKIPVVLYGKGKDTLSLSVNAQEFRKHLTHGKGKNNIFTLTCKGKDYPAVPYEIQLHPINKDILHVDMKLVNEKEKVRVHVPIRKKGIAIGAKKGGKFDQKLEMLILKLLPNEIPREIIVDVSRLDVGQEICVKDIMLPPSAEVVKTSQNQRVFFVKASAAAVE